MTTVQGRVEHATGRTVRTADPVPLVVDAAIGVGLRATDVAVRMARAASPVVGYALRPPIVPRRFWPQTRLEAMAARGRAARIEADRDITALVAELIPAVLDAVLDQIDLTQLVLDRVQLDRIAASLDVNAVAGRLDLVPIVDRVPIDRVLARVDVDSVVAGVDLDAVVRRLDINAIAAGLDLDAIISRINLAELANEVIEQIDLVDLIRESSGAMASETVRGVRLQSINADERVNRIVDRVLLRRRPDSSARVEEDRDDTER